MGIFISLSLFAQGPDITWQKLLGGTDTDAGLDIQSTADGGYIIAATSDSYDGDIDAPLGHYDFWIIKLDDKGDTEWKNNYGGTDWEWPKSIKQTTDGGYIAIGFTYSDDGDVTDFKGLRDAWVIKLDASGTLEWQKSIGGTGPDSGEDILVLNDGYLMVGFDGGENNGDLQGMACTGEFWILKLNLSGDILWQKCYGGSGIDYPEKMIPLSNGNFVIAGYTDSDDGEVTGYHGSYDFWVIAIDPNGNMAWQKALGGSSWDKGFDVLDTGQGIIVVGETLSQDGDVTGSKGGSDFWVIKLDYNGDLQWQKSFGGSDEDIARSIIDAGNSEYVISGVASSADIDVDGNHGSGDYWVIKIDDNGNLLWNKSMGGSGSELIYSAVMSTSDDGIFFLGYTNSNNGDVSGLQGDDDVWIVKLGGIPSATENILNQESVLKIYPNPVHNLETVYIENNLVDAEWLRVFNIEGQLVAETSIENENGLIRLSVANWIPGSYFIELSSPNNLQIGKMIIFNR